MKNRRDSIVIDGALQKALDRVLSVEMPDVHDLALVMLWRIADTLEATNGKSHEVGWRRWPRQYGPTAGVGSGIAAILYLLLRVIESIRGTGLD